MAGLGYEEGSLSQTIDNELHCYFGYFNRPLKNMLPVLMFPIELGKIVTKCIRYHAAMYNLVAFYVEMTGKLFIVLCQHNNLKPYYQRLYDENYCCSQEDSEIVHPYRLYTSIQVNISSLASERKRRTFGLDYKNFYNQQNNNNSTARSHNVFTNFLHVVKNYLNVFPVYEPYPLLKDLPVTQPTIEALFEKLQQEDLNCMGDSLFTNPTDDKSSTADKLNILPLETVPILASEGTTGGYGKQFFKLEYFMDQVLQCAPNLPIIVQARNDYEPYRYLSDQNLNSVVELYDIPSVYKTFDLLCIFNFGRRFIKWCDNNHALLIYAERDHADMALLLDHPTIRARPMIEASPIATVVACMMDFPTIFQHLRNKQKNYY